MKQIVDWVDATLGALGYIQRFEGLCKTVTRPGTEDGTDRYPAKIGYEETPIDFEGGFAYLRLGQLSDEALDDEACGKRVIRTFPVTLVVGLPNDVLSTPNEYIALKVAQNISNSLQVTSNKALREAISAENVEVDISAMQTDSYEIWTTERNDPYALPTDHFLLSMLVTFTVQGHISCFEILGCDDVESELLQKYVDSDDVEKEAPFGSKIVCTPFCTLLDELPISDIDACFNSLDAGRQTDIQNAICPVCPDPNTFTCAQLNNTTTGLTVAQRQQVQRVWELKTGQMTSYATGDDGDLEDGRQVDFLTMSCVTPDGTTARFFDNGDGTVTDWATGKMWVKATQTAAVWATAIANAEALSFAGFSDWHMANRRLMESLLYFDEVSFAPMTSVLGYSPFLIGVVALWTSTTNPGTAADAYQLASTASGNIVTLDKTVSRAYMVYRNL